MKDKINMTKDKWNLLLLALETKMNELNGLPEPLRSREMMPFIDLHKEIMALVGIDEYTESPEQASS